MKAGSVEICLMIESALGVYNCYALIKASPRVRATCIGSARDGDLLPGIKAHVETKHSEQYPAWPDLVAAWRADLERIALQFADGVSIVDPKRYPQTCQFCDQQPFCRIRERMGEPVTDEDVGE